MTSKRWLSWFWALAAGLWLVLGGGHGIAAAESDETGADAAAPTSESSISDTASNDAVGQPDSTGSGGPATPDRDAPEAKVSASTVTVRDEPEPEPDVQPEPDVEPEPDAAPTEEATPAERDAEPDAAAPAAKSTQRSVPAASQQEALAVREQPAAAQEPGFQRDVESAAVVAEPAAAVADEPGQTVEATPAEARAMLVASAAAPAEPPATPSLIQIVGALLFDLVTLPLRLFEQTPVIPPGSSVSIGRSRLDVGCGCGQSVDARWYFPNQDEPPESVIYLQHGFLRSNSALSALAVQLAEQTNSVVVAPTLTSNPFTADGCALNGVPMQRAVADLFTGERAALTDSAVAAGWTGGALPTKFVLSGHSAGGGLAVAAAGYTVDNGAVSDLLLVVMLDGVPNGDALPTALAKLQGANYRDVFQIAAPPYSWNANGIGTTQLQQARPGQFVGVQLAGGSHIDPEGTSTDILAQIACGASKPQNIAAVQDLAVGWINDAINGTQDGVYGEPGTTVILTTASGDATGLLLGTPADVAAVV